MNLAGSACVAGYGDDCTAFFEFAYNSASMTVQIRSFAKINLGLRIGPRREDGFHELLTVYQTIALHDVMRVNVARGTGIEIRCEDSRVPCDASNTCYRIVEKAMRAFKAKGRVAVEIDKRLPVQGGMGGASSNAVAALLGLERALKKSVPVQERLRIAAEVGSDLPLFLLGGTVLGVGRGEQVYPLEDLPATACVVVTPEVGVSTPKAFAEWDRMCGAGTLPRRDLMGESNVENSGQSLTGRSTRHHMSARPSASRGKLTSGDSSDRMVELGREFSAWLSESYSGAPRGQRGRAGNPLLGLVRTGIQNDFERVVFPDYPELSEVKKALVRAGAKYASLSGSGSTLYGLFASKEAAQIAAEKLRAQGWVAQSTVTLPRLGYWRKVFVG
jgi:4-diphosphocytidyl-2-C-methyl-D-erythritol kinase